MTDSGVLIDDEVVVDAQNTSPAEEPPPPVRPPNTVRLALILGVTTVCTLGAVVGWLGWQVRESHRVDQQRGVFVEVARQAAINLTTIDAAAVDADVKRILDGSVGSFRDGFASRVGRFVDVVREAQSKSVGEVTSAGIESSDTTGARVLVAVSVRTSRAGAPEEGPRAWRMRISVTGTGADVKVANVEFVP